MARKAESAALTGIWCLDRVTLQTVLGWADSGILLITTAGVVDYVGVMGVFHSFRTTEALY